MKKKIPVPKDLGLKLGTPMEVLWTSVRDHNKTLMADARNTLIVSSALLRLSEQKIAEEKDKLK